MKRVFIGTCIAAACAVGLSAQQTATSTAPQSGRQKMGGPMTLSGCVKAGDTSGTYMLTNVQRGDTGAGSGAATTTAGAATSTGGGQGMGRGMGQIMLNAGSSSVDLSAHVGHKVEVTGTMSGGRGRMAGGAATTTGGGATTTGGTSAGAAGGTTAGGATTTAGQGGGRGMRTMNVTALKMISTDCGS